MVTKPSDEVLAKLNTAVDDLATAHAEWDNARIALRSAETQEMNTRNKLEKAQKTFDAVNKELRSHFEGRTPWVGKGNS